MGSITYTAGLVSCVLYFLHRFIVSSIFEATCNCCSFVHTTLTIEYDKDGDCCVIEPRINFNLPIIHFPLVYSLKRPCATVDERENVELKFGGGWKKMKLRRIVNSTLGAVALLHYFFSSWIIGTSDRKRPKAKPLQQQILRARAHAASVYVINYRALI